MSTATEKLRVKIVKLKKMNYTNFDNITSGVSIPDHGKGGKNFTYKIPDSELDYLNEQGLVPVNFNMKATNLKMPIKGENETFGVRVMSTLHTISSSTIYRIVNNGLWGYSDLLYEAVISCIERDAFVIPEMFQQDQVVSNLDGLKIAGNVSYSSSRKDKPDIYRYSPVVAFDFDFEIANDLTNSWSGTGASNKGGYNIATDNHSGSHADGELYQSTVGGAGKWQQSYTVASWSGSLTEVNAYESARDEVIQSLDTLLDGKKITQIKKDENTNVNAITQTFSFTCPNVDLDDVVALSNQSTVDDIYGAVVYKDGTDPFPSGSSPVYDDTLTVANCAMFGLVMSHSLTNNGISFSCKRLVLEEGFQNCLTTRIA